MSRLTATVLFALALSWATSCAAYRVQEYETVVRFLPQEDAILMPEVEHGIEANSTGPAPVRLAVEGLRSADEGRRRYPAAGGMLSVDFDDAESMQALDLNRTAEFQEFAASVHVEDQGIFLDAGGRLSFFRLTRFEHCARLLELVNAWIRREITDMDEASRAFMPGFPFYDIESWNLALSAIESGHPLLSIEGDLVVLDVPMTSANAARCFSHFVAEDSATEDVTRQFFDQVSTLEVSGGHTRLRFLGAARPVARFFGKSQDAEYDDAVKESLRLLGVNPPGPEVAAEARKKFDAAGKPRTK